MKRLILMVFCMIVLLLSACGTDKSDDTLAQIETPVESIEQTSETEETIIDYNQNESDHSAESNPASDSDCSSDEENEEAVAEVISEQEPYSPVLDESEDMGMEYIDKIIFIGDSTSYRMKMNGVLTDGKNTEQIWTGANGTMTLSYQSFIKVPYKGREVTLREAAALEQPEYIVITLGLNGVVFMDEDYFTSQYSDLVEGIIEATPNTAIMLQSVFPVSADYPNIHQINKDVLDKCNSWILGIAEKYGLRYLDTTSVLVDETGYMKKEYDCGDGFHMNADGLTEVVNYIRTHAYVPKPGN